MPNTQSLAEQDVKVTRGAEVSPYFIAWSQYGTRYRLFALPLKSFEQDVREEVGAGTTATLVTLWGGACSSAIFNAGGGPLMNTYIAQKLGIDGEDLAAVGDKLRALLVREGA